MIQQMADGPHTHAHSATMLAPYVVCEPFLFVISAIGGAFETDSRQTVVVDCFQASRPRVLPQLLL